MKVHLSKGHGMRADLKLDFYQVLAQKDSEGLPPGERGWSVRILGTADEEVDLHGRTEELEEVIKELSKVLKAIKKNEEEELE